MQSPRSTTTSPASRGASGPPRPAPPAPHDPAERDLLLRIGDWEVRRFPEDGKLFGYAAPRGMLHVQLWHPASGVSVLTPSRITGGHYEAYPIGGWKGASRDLGQIAAAIRGEHRIAVPRARRVASLERWFVGAAERRALRSFLAGAVFSRRS
jgi:hypothetical protein